MSALDYIGRNSSSELEAFILATAIFITRTTAPCPVETLCHWRQTACVSSGLYATSLVSLLLYGLTEILEHTDQTDWTYSGADTNVQAIRAPPSLISAEIAIVCPAAQTLAGRQTSIGNLGNGCVGEAAHRVDTVGGDARHITIVWKERPIGGVALRRCNAQEWD